MLNWLLGRTDRTSAARSAFHDAIPAAEPGIGIDPGGRVVGVTEAAARLCGAEEREFLGRDLSDFLRLCGPRSRSEGVLSFPGRNSLVVRIRLSPLRAAGRGLIGYALLLGPT